ncbi:MAG TPA: hypothetical protein VGO72_07020 [Herminiimonas sp.]|nr:hypothetical protein [Herminiimonas sp.]
MRNFLPIGLFAATASLAIFGTPSFHVDSFAAGKTANRWSDASSQRTGVQLEEDSLSGERSDLRFFVPRCDRQSPCVIRRPMT